MSFQNKYLKYKQKYLDLKQTGGIIIKSLALKSFEKELSKDYAGGVVGRITNLDKFLDKYEFHTTHIDVTGITITLQLLQEYFDTNHYPINSNDQIQRLIRLNLHVYIKKITFDRRFNDRIDLFVQFPNLRRLVFERFRKPQGVIINFFLIFK